MSSKLYFFLTLFGGIFGLHKFVTGQFKMGLLYLLTGGLFGIGWVCDVIRAAAIMNRPVVINPVNYNNDLNAKSSKYFSTLQEIESMWSVMYNLKLMSGEKADAFEIKCKENIVELYDMLDASKKAKFDSSVPPSVPAYIRLAMLYERQERYQDAINICVDAIKAGAIDDGSKGKMYGRLARLIRKSGIEVNDDILSLTLKSP